MPKMLTTAEAADALRVSDQTIRRYLKGGKLTAAKVGRQWLIPEEQVSALLSEQPTKPAHE